MHLAKLISGDDIVVVRIKLLEEGLQREHSV